MAGDERSPDEAAVLLARIIERHAALIENETRDTFMRYFKPAQALSDDDLEELRLYDRFMTADSIPGDMDSHYVYLESRGVSASTPELTLEFFQGCLLILDAVEQKSRHTQWTRREQLDNQHALRDLIFPDGARTEQVLSIISKRRLVDAAQIKRILEAMDQSGAPLQEGTL